MFIPLKNATLLLPSGPNHDKNRKHLFVILNNPIMHEGNKRVALVNISSVHINVYCDSTCILKPGDHAFVKRESYVRYDKAQVEKIDILIGKVKEGVYIPHQPMVSEVCDRICKGLIESPHTPTRVQRFYFSYLNQGEISHDIGKILLYN